MDKNYDNFFKDLLNQGMFKETLPDNVKNKKFIFSLTFFSDKHNSNATIGTDSLEEIDEIFRQIKVHILRSYKKELKDE